jgi:peptidoglycan/xylan/chitin deacetylase (PgdA/CDA1 family)
VSREVVRFDWCEEDPFLVGPWRMPESAAARPFEAPQEGAEGVRVGRITSGRGWPRSLAPIDRPAAFPVIEEDRVGSLCSSDEIVLYGDDGSQTLPLCGHSEASGGAIVWNFDPTRWLQSLLAEDCVSDWVRPLPSRVPLLNYNRAPHALKGLLQPRLDPERSNPVSFPQVPLDDLVETLRELCVTLACDQPAEPLPVWPDGRLAAVTVTHDVDTSWILEPEQRGVLGEILDAESRLGFRGAWYVTACQLDRRRHAPALSAILDAGHEIGAHGWNHDARLDYLSEDGQRRRMRRIEARMLGLGAAGFRTPWYCRSAQLMGILPDHFAYSSSVPNASAFFSRSTNSGCCTLFPYRTVGDFFEVPLTLPPDGGAEPERFYGTLRSLADRIIERRGVVMATLHPQPHQSAKSEILRAYSDFLEDLQTRRGAEIWHATPGEIVARYRDAIREAAETRPLRAEPEPPPPPPPREPEPEPAAEPEAEPMPEPVGRDPWLPET